MTTAVLLVPPIHQTLINPAMMSNWLANQLRNLGRFASSPSIPGDDSHQNDREYHRFARTFPFVGDWEQAQQVADSFSVILVPSPTIHLRREVLSGLSDVVQASREEIEDALHECVCRFFGIEVGPDDLQTLAALVKGSLVDGDVAKAKKGHPILEALLWISSVDDAKLLEYVKQFAIPVEKLEHA
jgi:hypothetical protein